MSPMHRRYVPVDAGTSPSLTTIWKPGLAHLEDLRFSYVEPVTVAEAKTNRCGSRIGRQRFSICLNKKTVSVNPKVNR